MHRREERRDERLVPAKSPRLDINNEVDDDDDKEDFFASNVNNDGEFRFNGGVVIMFLGSGPEGDEVL